MPQGTDTQSQRTPGDGRRFTEIYNVDKLTGAGMLGSSNVVVSTIQRVFKALRNEDVTTSDDPNLDDYVPFMRDVRSAQYFEQMKGRGARTIAVNGQTMSVPRVTMTLRVAPSCMA